MATDVQPQNLTLSLWNFLDEGNWRNDYPDEDEQWSDSSQDRKYYEDYGFDSGELTSKAGLGRARYVVPQLSKERVTIQCSDVSAPSWHHYPGMDKWELFDKTQEWTFFTQNKRGSGSRAASGPRSTTKCCRSNNWPPTDHAWKYKHIRSALKYLFNLTSFM